VRRLMAASLVFLALSACGETQRPEGIVERWLQSLDQGRAGTPERYATTDEVSEEVLAGYRDLAPGQFDVIEVGEAREPAGVTRPDSSRIVPVRIVTTDGVEQRLNVVTVPLAAGWRVAGIDSQDPVGVLPSEGGPANAGISSVAWLAGVSAALLLTAIALLLMAFVRRSVRGAA
jgi:hypothetical protein